MKREWYRGIQWPADDSEAIWAPVIQRAAATWAELEVLTVSARLRPSALLFLSPEEAAQATRDAAGIGLQLTCVAPGRFALHWPGAWQEWVRAAGGDDELTGQLLGYPDCCRKHFAETWAQGRDHLAAMPVANGPWPANIFLRTLGVRLVPWLPCSATCPATVAWAERAVALGLESGLDMAPLEALLRLPATWDARNGAAVITTPVFRLCVSSDVREGHEVREREGRVLVPEPAYWEDSGFSNLQARQDAHRVLLAALGPVSSALDLGAGDGALLAALAQRSPGGGPWFGVECDPGRASRGQRRHPAVVMHEGLIQEAPLDLQPFDVVLLMPGRLLEMRQEDADHVRRFLAGRRTLLYTYSDSGPLPQLAARAGFNLAGPVTSDGKTSAAFAEVA